MTVHAAEDRQRAAVETFIRGVFARRYGADVRQFSPVLVSLQEGGRILAAAGYRNAGKAPLFLERYLPAPVDRLLAVAGEAPPARSGVVEVGHLAAERPGEGRRLMALLGLHLAAQDVQWVVGTITKELRHLFIRLGVTPLALGAAHADALGMEAQQWGSYYEHQPIVLAGRMAQALRFMERAPGSSGSAA